MKKFLAIGLISLMFCLPAGAIEGKQPNLISAKGTAQTDVKPDTANITIAVETEAKKLQDAINENNTKSNQVYVSLKKAVGKDGQVKTANFRVMPVYSYDRNTSKQNLDGYRVTNEINAKTKDITKVGEIIEVALNDGANRITSLNYEVSNRDAVCRSLLDDAAKNARKDADILAKALGVKITGIRKISSSCNNFQPMPYRMQGMAVMSEAAMAAPPVEAGETNVSVEVYVDFIIE